MTGQPIDNIPIRLSYVKTSEGQQMARIIDGAEMNLIGSNLKRLRQERGWSQQLLSNKLETVAVYICRGSISRIEDKQRTVTDIELYGLANVLGVAITDLFE